MRLTDWYSRRTSRGKGFILPLALVFLVVLLLLEVGLVSLQQRAYQASLDEESRLGQLLGTEEVYANLAQAIETSAPSGPVTIGKTVDYQVPISKLSVSTKWSEKQSVNVPLPTGWSSYKNVVQDLKNLPAAAFQQSDSVEAHGSKIAPGHTVMTLAVSNPKLGVSLASYSELFPYGIYAPNGNVVAENVKAYSNPVYEEENEVALTDSGRPVDVLAGGSIEVKQSYSSGRAMSASGPVKLPAGNSNGAVPSSGQNVNKRHWEKEFRELTELAATVAAGSVNKTEFFDDQLFTMDHLKKIFSGHPEDLLSIFSVGQACKVPFFPIPGMQDDAPFLLVFYVMFPNPVDFSGAVRSHEDSLKLKEIGEEIQAKQTAMKPLLEEYEEESEKEKPDEAKLDRLKDEISDLKDEIKHLKKKAKAIAKKKHDSAKKIKGKISQARVPETAAEDAEQVTKGWTYAIILEDLWGFVKDLIAGRDPFEALITPTRVIHLGDNNPEWEWPGGNLKMKATLTVPRGRSLHIEKPEVEVVGDIYLHPGAVLKIDGDLKVSRPADWTDFKGTAVSEDNSIAYPKGRIIMEEGSSLVVGGNLRVEGGTRHEGSIMAITRYGANRAMTRVISAGGDIEVAYGMMPGVELGDLVDKLAEKNAGLTAFNDDFFRPLTEEVAPQVAKLPYVGPWQWRKCWFAEYSTTFEFIPILEVIGLGGPWPIPLPFPNCLRKVFKYLSVIYSTELNFFTGENLYTQSPFWPFGRGVSPVLLKVRPEVIAHNLEDIKWQKISLDALEEEGEKFLKEALPDLAANIVQEIIVEVLIKVAESLIPFSPPTCGGKENHVAKDMKEKAEEFLKDVLKEFGDIVGRSFKRTLLDLKNNFYSEMNGGDAKNTIMRELPGLVLIAEGSIEIGKEEEVVLALGLLVAKNNINVNTEHMVGVLVALEGNVEVGTLYHYPFFDRISLYSPKKFNEIFESQASFLDPEGSLAGDVSKAYPRRLAEGWVK